MRSAAHERTATHPIDHVHRGSRADAAAFSPQLVLSFLVLLFGLGLLLSPGLRAATFSGQGVGSIPDGPPGCGSVSGASLDVAFEVLGLSGRPSRVTVDLTAAHGYVGDLDVILISPLGDQHVLFAQTGSGGGCGDNSNMAGDYRFDDLARGDWWFEAASRNDGEALTPGAYRTSSPGPGGGVPTSMTGAFALSELNGTWILRVRDTAAGDIGAVTSASLSIDAPGCPTSLLLTDTTISSPQIRSACGPIDVGPGVLLAAPGGDLTLQSTDSVRLASGFAVESGARLRIGVDATGDFQSYLAPGDAIPDGDPAGVALSFQVSGVSEPVRRVQVAMTIAHDWIGDLAAILESPGGLARLVLFGNVGHRPNAFGGSPGVSANLDGTYVFDDFALASLWDAVVPLDSGDTIPEGTYRTSTPAAFRDATLLSNAGGCSTYLSGAFSGLSPAQANGTWKLTLIDRFSTVAGTVAAATLRIEAGSSIPANRILGLVAPGRCTPAPYDFTGTGRTSHAVIRDEGGAIRWLVRGNDGTATGQPLQTFVLGISSEDFLVAGDYDGDGLADAAVWNSASATTTIRRSSRPGDVPLVFALGSQGDDPTVVGDYDGDRVTDPTIVRFPSGTPGLGVVLNLRSTDGGTIIRSFPTVVGTLFSAFPNGGDDFNGDGIADIAFQTQSVTTPGDAHFTLFDGASGLPVEEFEFGLATDLLVPGNHVGHSWADVTIVRRVSNELEWFTRDGQTGLGSDTVGTLLGLSGDFVLSGDWDGDGIDDLAVFRWDTTNPANTRFIVRQSSGPTPSLEIFFGAPGDYPVANSRVQ